MAVLKFPGLQSGSGQKKMSKNTENHKSGIVETSPKHPQNIPKTSPEHPQNIPRTSPKHHQNITKTSPTHPQNIPKTSPKQSQNTTPTRVLRYWKGAHRLWDVLLFFVALKKIEISSGGISSCDPFCKTSAVTLVLAMDEHM